MTQLGKKPRLSSASAVRLWVLVAGLEHVGVVLCGVVDMFDLTQLLDAGLAVTWRRRLATRPSTLDDVVLNSYCVRSAVLVVEYIVPGSSGGVFLSVSCSDRNTRMLYLTKPWLDDVQLRRFLCPGRGCEEIGF